jgi:hypothetical protein
LLGQVLNEIMLNDRDKGCGGMAINQALIHHLLGRLNDFNEWGLHVVRARHTVHRNHSERRTTENLKTTRIERKIVACASTMVS